MGKIVDLLTYRKRSSDEREYNSILSSSILTENFNADIKEKIASTYILNPLNKRASPQKNAINKSDIMSNGNAPRLSAKIFRVFPWLIALLAILLLFVNIMYHGKVNVKIEIVENARKTQAIISDANVTATRDSSSFILDGQLNGSMIKRIGFYGAAFKDSRISKDGLFLINDGTVSWASAGFDLIGPMDLTDGSIEFFAKGLSGNESLEVILRDSDINSYLPQARNLVFNGNMGADWQFVSVPFSAFKGYYNARHVSHIGFEFGTQTTSNKHGASIYIKNIKIVNPSSPHDL